MQLRDSIYECGPSDLLNFVIFPSFLQKNSVLIQIACTAYRTLHLEKISNYQSIILKNNFVVVVKAVKINIKKKKQPDFIKGESCIDRVFEFILK